LKYQTQLNELCLLNAGYLSPFEFSKVLCNVRNGVRSDRVYIKPK